MAVSAPSAAQMATDLNRSQQRRANTSQSTDEAKTKAKKSKREANTAMPTLVPELGCSVFRPSVRLCLPLRWPRLQNGNCATKHMSHRHVAITIHPPSPLSSPALLPARQLTQRPETHPDKATPNCNKRNEPTQATTQSITHSFVLKLIHVCHYFSQILWISWPEENKLRFVSSVIWDGHRAVMCVYF